MYLTFLLFSFLTCRRIAISGEMWRDVARTVCESCQFSPVVASERITSGLLTSGSVVRVHHGSPLNSNKWQGLTLLLFSFVGAVVIIFLLSFLLLHKIRFNYGSGLPLIQRSGNLGGGVRVGVDVPGERDGLRVA